MKKFRFNKSMEIGIFISLLVACMKFAYHLYSVFIRIKITESTITDVVFNIYHFKIVTTVEEYEVYILPTYLITIFLIIYLLELVVAYIKHCLQMRK